MPVVFEEPRSLCKALEVARWVGAHPDSHERQIGAILGCLLPDLKIRYRGQVAEYGGRVFDEVFGSLSQEDREALLERVTTEAIPMFQAFVAPGSLPAAEEVSDLVAYFGDPVASTG